MDVDDVDGKLTQAMGCLGTVDHDTLIRQFQQLIGADEKMPAEMCAFFLDMNNWNLQAAVGSFYDYGNTMNGVVGPLEPLPQMTFVQDITIGEGESIPPNTRFTKTWRLRNSGAQRWPFGCYLRHIEGNLMANAKEIMVAALEINETTDISVDMMSPDKPGMYQSRWQLNRGDAQPFGEPIWCIIIVEDCGLLGITQQLASVSTNTTPVKQFSYPVLGDSPSSALDSSTSAVRGSPAAMSHSDTQQYDLPSSPNGSSTLHQHVQQQLMTQQQAVCSSSSSSSSQPLPIASCSSSSSQPQQPDTPHHRRQPVVPPCTPSTPPFSSECNMDDSGGRASSHNVCVVTPTQQQHVNRFDQSHLM